MNLAKKYTTYHSQKLVPIARLSQLILPIRYKRYHPTCLHNAAAFHPFIALA